MYKAIILPLAKQDIKKATHWYNKQQKGLGKKFTAQIRSEIQFLKQKPDAIETRYEDVKTCIVKIFPFMIHYRVDKLNKLILISGVFHTSLDTRNWKKRS